MAKKKIRDIDKGWKKYARTWKRLSKPTFVSVGIQGSEARAVEHEGDEVTNVQIASFHEFGGPSGNDPPKRSFIRGTVDQNRTQIEAWVKRIKWVVANPKVTDRTVQQALGRVGAKVGAMMVNRINQGIPPKLSDATLRQRAKKKPSKSQKGAARAAALGAGLALKTIKNATALVDTGAMKLALTWKVTIAGKKKKANKL